MIDPLRLAFEVDAPQEHAFDTYTRGLGRWWPADHTHTGRADLRIEMEGRVGGRIFERTPERTSSTGAGSWSGNRPADSCIRGTCGATRTKRPRWRSCSARSGRTPRGSRSSIAAGAPGGRRTDLARSECRRLGDPAAARRRPSRRRPEQRRRRDDGSGTKEDPWVLKTPPGTSEYQMWRDESARSAGDRLPGRVDAAQVPPQRDRRPARDAQGPRRLDGPWRRR